MKHVLLAGIALVMAMSSCTKEDADVTPHPQLASATLPFESNTLAVSVASTTLPLGTTSIYFLSEATGLATTYEGKIYRSLDHGLTWAPQYSTAVPNQPLYRLLFTDQRTGYAVGGRSSCGGAGCVPPGGIILKTTDGGTTWQTVYTGTQNEFVSIAVNPNGNLFAAANGAPGGLFRSTDAGASWQPVENAGNSLSTVVFTKQAGFYTGGGAQIVRSNDAGTTWTFRTALTYNYVNDLAFTSETGYYALGYAKVFRTTDTGEHWTEFQNPIVSVEKISTLTPSSGLLWGAGSSSGGDFPVQYGAVGQTTDGGKTWTGTEFPGIPRISAAHFYTPQQGYAVAGKTLLKVTVK